MLPYATTLPLIFVGAQTVGHDYERAEVRPALRGLWIDVQSSSTGYYFLGRGIWLPSNKNIATALFCYNRLSAEWSNSPPKSCFAFWACTLCGLHAAGPGRSSLNKCHFSVVFKCLFSLCGSIQAFNTFSSPLSLSLSLFSTSRRVLLYSFVILIDCINLLSIEFPVHHAEHNVEYYHNPSK